MGQLKTKLFCISALLLNLNACYAPAPYPYAGYIAPIAPPSSVRIMAPIGIAPGPNWGWAYHPQLGWGWHHSQYGWRH